MSARDRAEAGVGTYTILPILLLAACQARAGDGSRSSAVEFKGTTAFSYVEKQLSFGPRIPNTPGHDKMGDWLLAELRARADTVIVQEFQQRTSKGQTLTLRNYFAQFRPQAPDRILFLAHWDTRPHADKSANLGDQRLPVPGANDGASGVAVLLGVADALKAKPPTVGVDLLFVDGEDYGDFSDSTETLLGARYFAKHQPPGYTTLFAVLFDMVGDKDLQFQQEGYSMVNAPEVVQRVWQMAQRLGYSRVFQPRTGQTLIDDHVPLQQAGIRAIDVIDFEFPYHHTTEDTLDKVSAESLQIVGNVAVALVRQ
ncbi:MAG TPA: M28 family peptidase [Gemmatimonadales bacterium]|nr:M28 family peptidase [Gemmatimonadales bacterium]